MQVDGCQLVQRVELRGYSISIWPVEEPAAHKTDNMKTEAVSRIYVHWRWSVGQW